MSRQNEILALQSINGTLDLQTSQDHINGLDSLLEIIQNLPVQLDQYSMSCQGVYRPEFFDQVSIMMDGQCRSINNNPRLPNHTLINAISFMKQKNFWYAEFSIKKSLDYKSWKTGRETVNENHRGLLSCLLIAQYAQEKYVSAIETGLRLYDANHKKIARKLVSQIAVKLDQRILEVEQKMQQELYYGFVRMSDNTRNRLIQEKDNLLAQRVYAGRALNYMRGNDYLWEVARKARPKQEEREMITTR